MAVVTAGPFVDFGSFYTGLDMSRADYLPNGEFGETLLAFTNNTVWIRTPYGRDTIFRGSFSQLPDGTPVGTITNYEVYVTGGPLDYAVSGFSLVGNGNTQNPADYFYYAERQDWFGLVNLVLSGADTISGGSQNDFIYGKNGNDFIYGFDGNDFLDGDAGDDVIDGGPGNDSLIGDDGNDTLDGGVGTDTLNGGAGDDTYIIGDADVIQDSSGTDTVQAYIPYTLGAGLENLTLLGSASFGVGNELNNQIIGNAASNPLLRGGGGADTILGGAGDDWIEGETGNDPFAGIAGNDYLQGDAGNDTILAGDGDDVIHGNQGVDILVGEGGNDLIFGDEDTDYVDGRAGNDQLYGNSGSDVIFGDQGQDSLYGGDGDDILMGERGEVNPVGDLDVIRGEAGNDLLNGGAGDDWIYGGEGSDIIDGRDGNDLIYGGPRADVIQGSAASAFNPATTGSDLFVYTQMADAGDAIYGFDTRPGDNDGIDLRPLFNALGYAGMDPRGDGYMTVTGGATPADSAVWIDANGGGDSFAQLLSVIGVAAAALTDAFFLFQ